MKPPLQITIKDIPETPAIEARLRLKAERLARFCGNINFCRVTLEVPEKRKHQGKLYNVRIDITVPGKELVVKRDLREDLYVSIRDAFHDARRELEEYVRIRRGDVKTHASTIVGKVVRLFPEGRYGFIEAYDGEEYYFHAINLVRPQFDNLKLGTIVRFTEAIAGDGLQANHVMAVRRRKSE